MSVFSLTRLENFLIEKLKFDLDEIGDCLEYGWTAEDGNWFELEIRKQLELNDFEKIKLFLNVETLYIKPSDPDKNYFYSITWILND